MKIAQKKFWFFYTCFEIKKERRIWMTKKFVKKIKTLSDYELDFTKSQLEDLKGLIYWLTFRIQSLEFDAGLEEASDLHSIKTILNLINLQINQICKLFRTVTDKKEDDNFDQKEN